MFHRLVWNHHLCGYYKYTIRSIYVTMIWCFSAAKEQVFTTEQTRAYVNISDFSCRPRLTVMFCNVFQLGNGGQAIDFFESGKSIIIHVSVCNGTTLTSGCCTSSSPCQIGGGVCSNDDQCEGSLRCGDKCQTFHDNAPQDADCCTGELIFSYGIYLKVGYHS